MAHYPIKLGILGGGQLGRMLLQVAANYPVETYVLEQGKDAPAASLCHYFIEGDIRDYDTVYAFGKKVDVLTIEIENVNTAALHRLEAEGVRVIPSPTVLDTIRDKGLQKSFYETHHIPTAPYILTTSREDVVAHSALLPAVHKLRTGGYDGKGVQVLRDGKDIQSAFDAPSVLERMVDIAVEISVIVACGQDGEIVAYPPVEMVFDPRYNLVDMLLSPARITDAQAKMATEVALKVAQSLDSPGLYAVELFIDQSGNIIVNETAPRAHNSGHQTIEGNYCSQYDMQMRILLGLPLGDTAIREPSLMLNLIGEEGYSGVASYEGMEEVMNMHKVYVHLYGKTHTKPGRKMGHVTMLGINATDLLEIGRSVKALFKVVSSD